jgi:hypothetical protein
MVGCTAATLYCPNDSVTRLQMAIFMYRQGNVTVQLVGNATGGTARLGTTDNQPVPSSSKPTSPQATSRFTTESRGKVKARRTNNQER